MKKKLGLFLLLLLGFCLCICPMVNAARTRAAKPLEVTFKIAKVAYQAGEPVEGTIEINNKFPGTLPAAFDIILAHDDKVFPPFTTSLKVPTGKTQFTLKQFGIPDFSLEADSVGLWRIVILQQNTDRSFTRVFQVRIHPASEPNMPLVEPSLECPIREE